MKKIYLIIFLFLFIFSSNLFADGCFIPFDSSKDIIEPNQTGIIIYNDMQEQLILGVNYKGDSNDFVWLIPVPSYPEIDVYNNILFYELSYITRPDIITGGSFFIIGGSSEFNSEDLVIIHEQKTLDTYDFTILSSNDSSSMIDWLNNNSYNISNDSEKIISEYIEKEYYFIAIKINNEKEIFEGNLQPISITFKTDQIIYPLKISSINKSKSEILLYIFSDSKTKIENNNKFKLEFSKLVDLDPNKFVIDYSFYLDDYRNNDFNLSYLKKYGGEIYTIDTLIKDKMFLTKYRAVLDYTEMVDDLIIVPDNNNDEFIKKDYKVYYIIMGIFGDLVFLSPILVGLFFLFRFLYRLFRKKN
ncbi:MAG: DUF2330 domain-containing protein [Candidatus ainarchaeum sp.]|jgi:hypothetical protein|nr:DUF2330 domain-containing protein [Candidatus ainarchaeum sp.]